MSTSAGYILQIENGQDRDNLTKELYGILLRSHKPFIGTPYAKLFVIFRDDVVIKIQVPKNETDSHYIRGVQDAKRVTFKELITELYMNGYISENYSLEV